ncbi:MAG: UvrB/UvrC motif-containing protein [Candidatus Omnitrophica bacterium]|nr:UvrB/UvrC motif-containing protein [Candidatus Omnitrophota bacterium]
MKCDKCTKKATVHLTEIVDGKVMEMHLCEDCAREQSEHMEQQFGLADLLAGLTDFGKHVPSVQGSTETLQCGACGLTYEDFRKFGRFGCAHCYVAFKPQLKTLLKKIHGSSTHLGKAPVHYVPLETGVAAPAAAPAATAVEAAVPVVTPQLSEIDVLRAELKAAIKHEDFEQAAILRDKIHALEGRS